MRGGILFVAGFIGILIVLEMAYRLLPTMSGLHPNTMTEAWPLRAYAPSRPYQYSYGWSMLNAHAGTTNNYGHISPHDFSAGSRPLIVVGDSYIESLMNDYDDTLQGVLGARLGIRKPVYGLGVSALSASDYVILASLAREEFHPAAAVFLITDGDMNESLVPRPGGYHLRRDGTELVAEYRPLTPNPGMQWVRQHVGDLALYDYLRGNLKFSPGDIVRAIRSRIGDSSPSHLQQESPIDGSRVLDWFLDELPRVSGIAPECTVLLVDADRYALYEPGFTTVPKDSPEVRHRLIERGNLMGFQMIDLGPIFEAEYRKTRLKFDYWPVDRHWNRHGHTVAANAVMNALFFDRPSTPCMPGVGGSRN